MDSNEKNPATGLNGKRLTVEEVISMLRKAIDSHTEPRAIYVNEAKGVVCTTFKDGSKQITRCSPDDHFDIEIAVALAIARNMCGSRSRFRRLIGLHSHTVGPKPRVSVKVADSQPDAPLPKTSRWLQAYLDANNLSVEDAAELTGLSKSTIKRACNGYVIWPASFDKITKTFELDEEAIADFRKSLTRHQTTFDKPVEDANE